MPPEHFCVKSCITCDLCVILLELLNQLRIRGTVEAVVAVFTFRGHCQFDLLGDEVDACISLSAHGFSGLPVVITAYEALAARRAREALLSRVRSQVALQFVASGESLSAEQPVADERSFSGMPTEVGLQMGRFVVHLSAARLSASRQFGQSQLDLFAVEYLKS
uniref:Uncharacterized protein n=1 Tax=Trichuris muris TaxID=70415 RepID=A0A5S6Q7L1_TRIMR